MISHLTRDFKKCFFRLPEYVKKVARKNYKLCKQDPSYPSIEFKQVHVSDIYSIRVGIGWRALGQIHSDRIIWFWIGSHNDYEKLISQM